MQSIDAAVLRQAKAWCDQRERPWLCTIVRAVGSSPRPVGSMLTCLDSGAICGSLSGGCVEEDLLARLEEGNIDDSAPVVIEYGATPEQNERLGLPCGGKLFVLVQRLQPSDRDWLTTATANLDKRCCVQRELDLGSGETLLSLVDRFCELSLDDSKLRQCFGPQMRMLLVGAGQLAQSLAELALAMDYQVIVTDPRQTTLQQWPGPQVTLLQGMPDDIVREHAADRHAIVVTLTHDPRIDDMALMEALLTDAWYIGALGSQRTTEKRLQRLRELDLPDAALARLRAPVGLNIGSKTPVEIAVSIMAEITALRRGA
jgi:xanthine dehydrogenase accessory factor